MRRMSKRPLMARFALFIALVMGLLAGIHYYLWVRLVRAPRLPAPWNRTLTFCLVLLALSLPAMLLVGRRYPQLAKVLAWPAFIWMGLMFLLFVMFLSADLARLFATVARRMAAKDAIDLARRTFVSRLTATLVAVFAIGASAVDRKSVV